MSLSTSHDGQTAYISYVTLDDDFRRKVDLGLPPTVLHFFKLIRCVSPDIAVSSSFGVIASQSLSHENGHQRSISQFIRGGVTLAAVKSNPLESSIFIVEKVPPPLPLLKNYYYLLRHGQSTANVEGIISSARSLANTDKHGLTLLGKEQGRESARPLIEFIAEDIQNGLLESSKNVYFYSSPFARAKETAYECLKGIGANNDVGDKVKNLGLCVKYDVVLEDGLMERYFGRLDGKELLTYAYVWPVDMFLPTHTAFDVESVAAVSERIRSAILRIESQHTSGDHIVLTSHADVLQISQVYAAGLENVGLFSQYRFRNGEVRRMGREVETLPEAVPLQPPERGQ